MKMFFSEKIIAEEGDDIFSALIDLIDLKYIRNRNLLLDDIMFHESLKKDKPAKFGTAFVHTARTNEISDCCLSCGECKKGNLEILIIWDDIFEYNLSDLVKVADLLEKMSKQKKSNSQIIAKLRNL